MNDKIKEKQLNEVLYGLDYIGNKIKNDDGKLELGVNNCKLLLDYITNLQQERDKFKLRCFKAYKMIWDNYGVLDKFEIEMLEDILNGRSDE